MERRGTLGSLAGKHAGPGAERAIRRVILWGSVIDGSTHNASSPGEGGDSHDVRSIAGVGIDVGVKN